MEAATVSVGIPMLGDRLLAIACGGLTPLNRWEAEGL
jgi:hypothetical protein